MERVFLLTVSLTTARADQAFFSFLFFLSLFFHKTAVHLHTEWAVSYIYISALTGDTNLRIQMQASYHNEAQQTLTLEDLPP